MASGHQARATAVARGETMSPDRVLNPLMPCERIAGLHGRLSVWNMLQTACQRWNASMIMATSVDQADDASQSRW